MSKDLSHFLGVIVQSFKDAVAKHQHKIERPARKVNCKHTKCINDKVSKSMKAAARIKAERSEQLKIERKELTKKLLRQRGVIPPK